MSALDDAKARLPIPALWRALGLRGSPGKCCRSPFREDRNPSFSVFDGGARFKDFGCPDHRGDAVDFIALARGLSRPDAARELIRMAGLTDRDPDRRPPPIHRVDAPPPIPDTVARIWEEGVGFLRDSGQDRARIAQWRGWTEGFVATLAEDGLIGMPLYRGSRGVAFPVHFPKRDGSPRLVGFHFRFPTRPGQDRARWTFLPTEREHGHGIPAVPFVVGTFAGARLLVIAEGQWDALTLCHGAGWFSHDAAWPGDVCAIGIRGSSGWRAFLDAYRPHWPSPRPGCLLLPDRDDAGGAWVEGPGETFLGSLRRLCRIVAVSGCSGEKDINDAHLARPITPAEVGAILLHFGLTDEKGFVL